MTEREGEGEEEGDGRESVGGELCGGCVLCEAEVLGAGGEGQGEEAVGAVEMVRACRRESYAVAFDLPGGVVAEIEDQDFGVAEVEVEGDGGGAGVGVGGWWGVVICGDGEETVARVVVLEGVVVGGGGGVFVGGLVARGGAEEGVAGLWGVFGVAGLVEGGVGGEDEGDGEQWQGKCNRRSLHSASLRSR